MSADILVRQSLRPRPVTSVARVGLLGCGVVGSAVARTLLGSADEVSAAAGARVELAGVAVLHPGKDRPFSLRRAPLSGDAAAVVDDPAVDVVVEVVGGLDPARRLVERALANGKSVVTANKELLGSHGHELACAAEEAGVDLFFEGAVCGAVPIAAVLRERLSAAAVRRVTGVVNGTTNFVLELMAGKGLSLEEAVAHAQRLGYAEADPAADLDGSDAAAKIAILWSLASGRWFTTADVEREGIRRLGPADLACARALGRVPKLIADAAGGHLRVRPALVGVDSPAGSVSGVTNRVLVDCGVFGRLTFRGPGAGGDATAGAVVADVVTAVRNRASGTRSPLITGAGVAVRPDPSQEERRWFVRVRAEDVEALPAREVARVQDDAGVVTDAVPRAHVDAAIEGLQERGARPGPVLAVIEEGET